MKSWKREVRAEVVLCCFPEAAKESLAKIKRKNIFVQPIDSGNALGHLGEKIMSFFCTSGKLIFSKTRSEILHIFLSSQRQNTRSQPRPLNEIKKCLDIRRSSIATAEHRSILKIEVYTKYTG